MEWTISKVHCFRKLSMVIGRCSLYFYLKITCCQVTAYLVDHLMSKHIIYTFISTLVKHELFNLLTALQSCQLKYMEDSSISINQLHNLPWVFAHSLLTRVLHLVQFCACCSVVNRGRSISLRIWLAMSSFTCTIEIFLQWTLDKPDIFKPV